MSLNLLTHIICVEGIGNGILGEKRKPAEVSKSAVDVYQRQPCTGRETDKCCQGFSGCWGHETHHHHASHPSTDPVLGTSVRISLIRGGGEL